MKRFHLNRLIFVLLAPVLTNCISDPTTDAGGGSVNTIEKRLTISNSDTLKYELGNLPVEGQITIKTPAAHAQLSEIKPDLNQGKLVYYYKTDTNFTGDDYVEIIYRYSSGSQTLVDGTLLKVYITVTEN